MFNKRIISVVLTVVVVINCVLAFNNDLIDQTEADTTVNKRFFGSIKHFFNKFHPHESCLRTFRQKMLDLTNTYRKKHGVSELVINLDLNKMAQKWAEKLAKLDQGIKVNHLHDQAIKESTFYISYIETLGRECSSITN